jgi:hypothetical protein
VVGVDNISLLTPKFGSNYWDHYLDAYL